MWRGHFLECLLGVICPLLSDQLSLNSSSGAVESLWLTGWAHLTEAMRSGAFSLRLNATRHCCCQGRFLKGFSSDFFVFSPTTHSPLPPWIWTRGTGFVHPAKHCTLGKENPISINLASFLRKGSLANDLSQKRGRLVNAQLKYIGDDEPHPS